jgi:hypothetical protein
MSDDLDYLRARVTGYRMYGDEDARHDSDMRVRAYVGERLAAARDKADGTLDETTAADLEALLMRCEFSDQAFVKRLEHADLSAAAEAALIKSDRAIVELADRVPQSEPAELETLIKSIGTLLADRADPLPAGPRAGRTR